MNYPGMFRYGVAILFDHTRTRDPHVSIYVDADLVHKTATLIEATKWIDYAIRPVDEWMEKAHG